MKRQKAQTKDIVNDIEYRLAKGKDYKSIVEFTDYWLAGRAKAKGVKNAGDDYFITRRQHVNYLKRYYVMIAIDTKSNKLIGWAVMMQSRVLIHLLVASNYRGKGIGKEIVKRLEPYIVRSKSDQSTGDPLEFYKKMNYEIISKSKIGKKKNIDVLRKIF